jgi:asparagine synthase (glutamine-hydrolysing)
MVSNDQIRENFPDVIWHCEIPLLRTAPVPLYLLSGLVRENQFKVVLTGEGSDEIFGGYNIYREAKVRHFWGQRPESRIRPLLIRRLYPYIFKGTSRGSSFLQRFFSVTPEDLYDPFFSHKIRWDNSRKNVTFFSGDLVAGFNGYDPLASLAVRLPSQFLKWDTLSKAQYLEMSIFLSNYLLSSQGDRVAMAHSLEIRLPFLDYRVIDFAFRLPARWKIKGLKEKYILKQASEGLVTDRVKARPKQPYRAPIKEVFFNDRSGDYVDHFLSEKSVKRAGYFDPKKVGFLVNKYKKADASFSNEFQNMAVVGILSTQILNDRFIENFPGRNAAPLVPDKIIRN